MSEDESEPCLSPDEERTLSSVLDEIIPPSADGRFPGAGELGVIRYIEQTLRQTPLLKPVITQGLSTIGSLAGHRNPGGFTALDRRDKLEVLREVERTEQAFLPSVVLCTYVGYYSNDRVVELLGLEPRPPHPKGHEMEANDLSILDQVRRRPKRYREC